MVVVDHPLIGLFPDLRQRTKDIAIKHLSSEAAVEAFDSGVFRWLARSDEVKHDVVPFTPQLQSGRDKLRTVVDANSLRLSSPLADPLQRLDHSACGKRSVDLDIKHLPIELIDDVEEAISSAVPECIAHEVHRPDLIRKLKSFQRCLDSFGQPLFRLTTDTKSKLLVDAINPFMVAFVSCIPNAKEQPPKSVSRMLLGKMIQNIDDFLVITHFRLVV